MTTTTITQPNRALSYLKSIKTILIAGIPFAIIHTGFVYYFAPSLGDQELLASLGRWGYTGMINTFMPILVYSLPVGITGLILFGGRAILKRTNGETSTSVKFLFKIILILVGSWTTTILAGIIISFIASVITT